MFLARSVHSSLSAGGGLIRYLLFFAACFIFSGCANYQLGTVSKVKFSTLFIAPVTNTAGIPQADSVLTTQIREAFVRDGRVALVNSPESADAVLRIAVTNYDRAMVVSKATDTGLARRFDVTLRGHATLTDNRTKEVYFAQRPLLVKRGVFTDSGLVTAEFQNLVILAEELAKETTHAVLDVW